MSGLTWKQVEEYIRDYRAHFKSEEVQIHNYLLAAYRAKKGHTKPVEAFQVSESWIKKMIGSETRVADDEILQAYVNHLNANSLKLREKGRNPQSIGLLREKGYLKFTQLSAKEQESGKSLWKFEEEPLEVGNPFSGEEEEPSEEEPAEWDSPSSEIKRLRAEITAKDQMILQLKNQLSKFETRLRALKSKSEFFHTHQGQADSVKSDEEGKKTLSPSPKTVPLKKIPTQIENLKKSIQTRQILIIGLIMVLYFITIAMWLKLRDSLNRVEKKIEFLQDRSSESAENMNKSELNFKTAPLDAKLGDETSLGEPSTPSEDACRNLWISGIKAKVGGEDQKALEIISQILNLPCAKDKDANGESWETRVETLSLLIKKELQSPEEQKQQPTTDYGSEPHTQSDSTTR